MAPRSVASPVAWAVQALHGRWEVPALPEGTRQKPPPMAVPAYMANWLARHHWVFPPPKAALPGTWEAQAGLAWVVAGSHAVCAMVALRLSGVNLEATWPGAVARWG